MEKEIKCADCRKILVDKDDIFYHKQRSFQGPRVKIIMCRKCYYKKMGYDWNEDNEL